MSTKFLLDSFERYGNSEAMVWNGRSFSYKWFLENTRQWFQKLEAEGIVPGAVAALEADFSPAAVALFLALVEKGVVVVPLSASLGAKKTEFIEIAQCEICFRIDASDALSVIRFPKKADHEFYSRLKEDGHAGLVLFSSGSTGKSKAVVHDMAKLLEKYKTPRAGMRTITFLLYDHIGGINTLLHTLSSGGCVITLSERSPDGVLSAVAKHRAEVLPTSPTFLNLVLLSEAHKRHDSSSLKVITYGTEPMLESTLKAVHSAFPNVKLSQTYGLSELGILRSKSKDSESLWVKVGGDGYETRIVDGILQIKAASAMLGYLNAPAPFTSDGWFITGDSVEVDGEYLRILGRLSDIINVGGEKVYPSEVESVIQSMANVAEVAVYSTKNPIIGNMVCARVRLEHPEEPGPFILKLKKYCREHLQPYKVPIKIELVDEKQHSERFKKMRSVS